MPSSQATPAAAGIIPGKRQSLRPQGGRVKKKQKRLDAIVDRPLAPSTSDDDRALLRRSSRARRVPIVLDSSPFPSHRLKKTNPDESSPIKRDTDGSSDKRKVSTFERKEPSLTPSTQEATGTRGWALRLRSTRGKGHGKTPIFTREEEALKLGMSPRGSRRRKRSLSEDESMVADTGAGKASVSSLVGEEENQEETPVVEVEVIELDTEQPGDHVPAVKPDVVTVKEKGGLVSQLLGSSRRGRKKKRKRSQIYDVRTDAENGKDHASVLPLANEEVTNEEALHLEEIMLDSHLRQECHELVVKPADALSLNEDPDQEDSFTEEKIDLNSHAKEAYELDKESVTAAETKEAREGAEHVHAGGQAETDKLDEPDKLNDISPADNAVGGELNDKAVEGEAALMESAGVPPALDDKLVKSRVKEGRRCGLCGGGTDGRPPKRLAHEISDSDKEAYEGSSASDEPNYNMWDGFGDEPGWLGRLLGPIHDQFGIARVWVHQNCAVWSPEVYFAGLGCLKNVRAALSRGRQLKCSRCGRPGATIGCRVDRCPKTYHLPCSRTDGCIFDHRKFLIACNDHTHLFQPQGNEYFCHIKKLKTKKLKLDLRKLSNDASRKDLEAEEKWLDNCGEDEEFLKREGRRLHRDILRIAPVYIGGSSESEKLYHGWESVAGLQDVIQCMKEVVILPLLYPEVFSSLGITPPRGILLHGYPGTGKTLVVRALIGACSRGDKRIAYFARKGADCLGKYVGDAERQLRLLFQVAEKSQPSIIFFDEIDGLAPCRSRHQDQTHCSVVSTLLSLLDGLKSRGSVIVIGATNRPDAVDPALRRPGRFDREIYFPLPSERDRSAILSLHTRSWPNPVSGTFLSQIAKQTAGYAGADLQSLCTQAAMNALKRNCALQELLSSVAKQSGLSRLPSLPSFVVEERDWLAALALAPPPCSRRDAGMAANELFSSPLPIHLVPCLLRPLLQLLISLYLDERIWIPPPLFKASKSIESVIISALEQKRVPIVSWWSHIHYLIQEPCIANEVERYLSFYGLIVRPTGSCQRDDLDYDNVEHHEFDSSRPMPSTAFSHRLEQKFHHKLGRSLGFRALISGLPRSGQQHLAGCLLHGFRGHTEIQKVTLASISHQGHGDIIRGLTHILLKCLNMGTCIIYMPRIDLWAIDSTLGEESEVKHERKNASEAWNSLVEQVDSACSSSSIIFLATCELENDDLPLGVRQFFTCDASDYVDTSPQHSIPRFFAHLDGNFNHDLVLNSCAEKLTVDLVQHFVQLVHHYTHMNSSEDKTCNSVEDFCKDQRQTMKNKQSSVELNPTVQPERIACNSGASCRDAQTKQDANIDLIHSVSQLRNFPEVDLKFHNSRNSFPRVLPNKAVRGNSMLAIASFGYQILQYPQFAELCWVTSKLKEGPCADVNGPLKRWPFNTCLMHPSTSPNKVTSGVISGNLKDEEHSSVVRGLIAVGLLAYRGVYTSVKEVSFEVRKVLEQSVRQIRAKILVSNDGYRYLRLLSQVAYLEDMVNNWAYSFRSLQADNQTSSKSKPVIVERLHADNNPSCDISTDNNSCMQSVPKINSDVVGEVSHAGMLQKFASNGENADICSRNADIALLNSDAHMESEANKHQEPSGLESLPSNLHTSSSFADIRLVGGDGPFGSQNTISNKLNGFGMAERSPIKANASYLNTSVSADGFYNGSGSITEKAGSVSDFTLKNNSHSAATEISCLYECCCECLHAVFALSRQILSDYWKLNARNSKIGDMHDTVASCSLNLLAAISKYCTPHSNTSSAEYSGQEYIHNTLSEHCACQAIDGDPLQKTACHHLTSKSKTSIPIECSFHPRNKEVAVTSNSERNSVFQSGLIFLFNRGVLLYSHPKKESVLHCKYEKLCTHSILEMLSMIKKPLD